MSLIEVLIAMGVLAIGLLGAMAMFPVGTYYVQRGLISDRANAVAEAALEDAAVRGLLDPEKWLAYETGGAGPGVMAGQAYTFTRPFADSLRGRMRQQRNTVLAAEQALGDTGAKATDWQETKRTNNEFGSAFVIDPVGVAMGQPITPATRRALISNFPAGSEMIPPSAMPNPNAPLANGTSWYPWGNNWPIKRVATKLPSTNPNSAWNYQEPNPANAPIYAAMMTSENDLAADLPDSADDPARLRYYAYSDSGTVRPVARQNQGVYSWFFTVVPTTPEGRDAMAFARSSSMYDVSAVVVHRRAASDPSAIINSERMMRASVVTRGVGGGEVLISFTGNLSFVPEPYEELKTGQYVMLTGPHPQSTPGRPLLFMQWYRVLNIEEEGLVAGSAINPANQRIVSLRGPDFPWAPGDQIANDLRVAIIQGAVGVHTRSMRLESPGAWSTN